MYYSPPSTYQRGRALKGVRLGVLTLYINHTIDKSSEEAASLFEHTLDKLTSQCAYLIPFDEPAFHQPRPCRSRSVRIPRLNPHLPHKPRPLNLSLRSLFNHKHQPSRPHRRRSNMAPRSTPPHGNNIPRIPHTSAAFPISNYPSSKSSRNINWMPLYTPIKQYR